MNRRGQRQLKLLPAGFAQPPSVGKVLRELCLSRCLPNKLLNLALHFRAGSAESKRFSPESTAAATFIPAGLGLTQDEFPNAKARGNVQKPSPPNLASNRKKPRRERFAAGRVAGERGKPGTELIQRRQIFGGSPTLSHQAEQMAQGGFVGLGLLGGELVGALIELRGHGQGFVRRTTKGGQDAGKVGVVHNDFPTWFRQVRHPGGQRGHRDRQPECPPAKGRTALFDAGRRDNFHAQQGLLGDRPVAGHGGRGGDLFQDVIPLDELAEGRVLAVEETGIAVADKELAAGRIGMVRARHGEDAAHVRLVVELRFDLMTRAARAPKMLLGVVFGIGIAALNHEAFDDAVKRRAVIKAGLRELLEIFDMFGRDLRPEFEDDFAGAGGKDGNFAHKNIQ